MTYSRLARLKGIVDRLSQIVDGSYSDINKARSLPADYMAVIGRFCIRKDYGALSAEENKIAQACFEVMKASEKERGKRERDQKLNSLAAELESLRAVLPDLAAQTTIEIGAIARALMAEASGCAQ